MTDYTKEFFNVRFTPISTAEKALKDLEELEK